MGHQTRAAQGSPSGGSDRSRPPVAASAILADEDAACFLGLSTELFAEFDVGRRLLWANRATAHTLGYAVEELRDVALSALVHPDDLGDADDLLYRRLDDPSPPAAATRWRCRDGTWRWLEWTSSWAFEEGRVFGAARDATDRHLAGDAVKASRGRLQAIIDHSPSAIFVKDMEGRYLLVNEAFLGPAGLQRQDVVGRTASEIWLRYEESPPGREALLLENGESVVRDDVVELADGVHTMMTVRFALRDVDGEIVGLAGVATDVSDRTEVESALAERERLLQTIVQASPDIVMILDQSGQVREVSEASARILGYEVHDPVHEDLDSLVHPDDLPTLSEASARLLTLQDRSFDLRYRVRHARGHWVTLDAQGRAIVGEDGRAVGALVMARDITGDLIFEAELLTAVGVAERASLTKSEFLSRMSHELRTPLNSVMGFAQLLEMDDLPDHQEQAVTQILRGGRTLSNLIDEVLDIARIESGHLDLSTEAVPVLGVVEEAVELAGPLAADREVRLTVDTGSCPVGTRVVADRQRLVQVLLYLLSNAVKFNRRGGRVTVTIVRTEAGRAEISITDTGPGIRAEDVDRVFEPFDRLGADRSGVEGTGVSLTLSKHLLKRMGGEIALRSTVGVGSTFTVLLPEAGG